MLNRPEFLETGVAAMKLGAMAVPMNVRFTPTEIAFLVVHVVCAIVVTDATPAPSLDAALAERPDLPVVLAEDFDLARRPTDLPFPVTVGDDDPPTSATRPARPVTPRPRCSPTDCYDASRARGRSARRPLRPSSTPLPAGVHRRALRGETTMWCGATLVLEPAFEPAEPSTSSSSSGSGVHGRAADPPTDRRPPPVRGRGPLAADRLDRRSGGAARLLPTYSIAT